jgi:L-threonylcarbamoyladenylate synthase
MDKATAEALCKTGAVGIIPTDTLYGLVARAADQDAVERLYELKQRENKPGTIIAASIDQLVELGIKRRYLTAVEHFWPGAISVITPCSDPALKYLHQGKLSVPVRIPDDDELLALLHETGPLQTTSANLPGQKPAATVGDAEVYFGNTVDFYVDGGNLSEREPSTIIRIVDDAIEIVREGAVKLDESGRRNDI